METNISTASKMTPASSDDTSDSTCLTKHDLDLAMDKLETQISDRIASFFQPLQEQLKEIQQSLSEVTNTADSAMGSKLVLQEDKPKRGSFIARPGSLP